MMKNKMSTDAKYGIFIRVVLFMMAACSLTPFVLLVMSSVSDEKAIIKYGYSFWPKAFSLEAYSYLMSTFDQIARAYGITILVTIIGTTTCLFITSMIAYPLSRKDMPLRSILSFFVFFTLLFNGGLVPTYLMYTQLFHLKNTIFGLIVPLLLMNAYYVLLMRTFFATSIPEALLEAAKIDGAGEFKIFFGIVLPLSKPILATIGLFAGMNYWNDWYNGLIYITDPELYSIQNILNRIIRDIQFLANNASLAGNSNELMASVPSETVRMAIAVIGILPILVIYPFVQKYFVKGIALGAVKG